MKYCVDCKFYRGWDTCCHPVYGEDIVTGKRYYGSAAWHRQTPQNCGHDAKFFEQKSPWWKFWSN